MSAKVIVSVLRADATIGPLIGNARIYPVDGIPKGVTRPFLDYQTTSNQAERDLGGNIIGYEAEFNLEVVADTELGVKTILDRMDTAFASLTNTTVAGVSVLAAQASGTGDEINGPIDLDDGQAYIGNATISIYYGA